MSTTRSRTFLVTGASKGIGLALSQQLATAGHQVVGIARNSDVPGFPGTLVSADLSDVSGTQGVIDDLLTRYEFDGLVNNVGFVRLAPVGSIDLDDMDDLFRQNLRPATQFAQALLPGMRKRGWGRIVNMSSLVVLGMRDRTAYAGSKAAMDSFTRTWALELADAGITVNSVAPGPTETEFFRQNTQVGSEAESRFLSLVPMKRFGKPEELAASIAFLLSEHAGFITGQTLRVDGGASIGKAPF